MVTSSSAVPDWLSPSVRVQFVGIAGSGMSALAAHRLRSGGLASGSDRVLDRGSSATGDALAAIGAALHPQDGSGVPGAGAVVASTAVEAHIPDLARARELGIPIVHRSEYLAALVAAGPSIAVAGTSGKSTTSAMIFHLLRETGADPGFVGGAPVLGGNDPLAHAHVGTGPLVVEADESDGTLVRYAPSIGVLLNLHRDHDDEEAIARQFRTFLERTLATRILGNDNALDALTQAEVIRVREDAPDGFRVLTRDGWHPTLSWRDLAVEVPMPGLHNLENAAMALTAAEAAGGDPQTLAHAMASFPGISRRFERLGEAHGVTVVDDYAHNPAKIAAALAAAQGLSPRVHLFWQPHGYGPTRFLMDELVALVGPLLRVSDSAWLGPIHDAGGTARRDVSSGDVSAAFAAAGHEVSALEDREALVAALRPRLQPGDLVLLTGARDPSLAAFAAGVLEGIRTG